MSDTPTFVNPLIAMYHNKDSHDVTFSFECGIEITAHSLVLSNCGSPYFDRMLNGQFREAGEKRVEMGDTDPFLFQIFIGRIYLGSWKSAIIIDGEANHLGIVGCHRMIGLLDMYGMPFNFIKEFMVQALPSKFEDVKDAHAWIDLYVFLFNLQERISLDMREWDTVCKLLYTRSADSLEYATIVSDTIKRGYDFSDALNIVKVLSASFNFRTTEILANVLMNCISSATEQKHISDTWEFMRLLVEQTGRNPTILLVPSIFLELAEKGWADPLDVLQYQVNGRNASVTSLSPLKWDERVKHTTVSTESTPKTRAAGEIMRRLIRKQRESEKARAIAFRAQNEGRE